MINVLSHILHYVFFLDMGTMYNFRNKLFWFYGVSSPAALIM